jgi:hypothetical protein
LKYSRTISLSRPVAMRRAGAVHLIKVSKQGGAMELISPRCTFTARLFA